MRKFKDFFETRNFVKNLNTMFIVMVPKKGGAEEFKDYRPISLVGSLYKLIAKVLANRLKRVMHSLINEAQNAFVEGRQIMDASLLTNEVIDTIWVKILTNYAPASTSLVLRQLQYSIVSICLYFIGLMCFICNPKFTNTLRMLWF